MDNFRNVQSQLTIIIPTRERSDFLERALIYYYKTGARQKFIIADSSTKSHLVRNKETIQKASLKLQISHEIYDESMEIIEKLGNSLSNVDTPYVVFGDDDDFFVPATLDQATDFMNNNLDYASVCGETLAVNLGSQKCHGKIKYTGIYPQKSVEDFDVHLRLIRHLSAYAPNWASVRRTNQLIEEWNFLKTHDWDIEFLELLPTSLSVISGKAKKMDRLYAVRQGGTPKSYVPFHSKMEWISSPSWSLQFDLFTRIVSEYLAFRTNTDIDTSKRTLNTAFWLYHTPKLCHEYENEMKKYWSNKKNIALKIANLPLIAIFRYLIVFLGINRLSEKNRINQLSHRIPSFKSDLHPITEAVECETYCFTN